ncbi:MAG: hypothetical protein ACRD1T_25530, partial [Acidimicrobiia bacterium]
LCDSALNFAHPLSARKPLENRNWKFDDAEFQCFDFRFREVGEGLRLFRLSGFDQVLLGI